MDMLEKHPWFTAVAALAVVVYVVVRRLSGEPLNARDLFGPPVILTGIGIYQVVKADGLAPADYAWMVGSIVIGVGFGAWRGSTVRLFLKNGALWQRYSPRTLLVWLASLVGSGGFALITVVAQMDPQARPNPLSIGIGLLGEMAVVGLRALVTGHRFAPESRDDNGVVHDHMRQTLNGTARREDVASTMALLVQRWAACVAVFLLLAGAPLFCCVQAWVRAWGSSGVAGWRSWSRVTIGACACSSTLIHSLVKQTRVKCFLVASLAAR